MMLDILGIKIDRVELSDSDRKLYQQWMDAKAAKDFATADNLREQLQQRGIM